jgi:hypothetical protein
MGIRTRGLDIKVSAPGNARPRGIMNSKPIRRAKKKLGRPKAAGAGERIGSRWQGPLLRSIDEWREAQKDEPSRAEAIRRLVMLGLSLERVVEKLIEDKRKDKKARARTPQTVR